MVRFFFLFSFCGSGDKLVSKLQLRLVSTAISNHQSIMNKIAFVCCLILLSSCKSYIIPIESFKAQFDTINATKLVDKTTIGPWRDVHKYKANPIQVIKCLNKEGKPAQLINRPSIEMRVTYGRKKKRTIFYFDKVYLENGYIVGGQSRILDFMEKKIPIDSVSKIEVKDGQKKYRYLN